MVKASGGTILGDTVVEVGGFLFGVGGISKVATTLPNVKKVCEGAMLSTQAHRHVASV